jgi:hypothetical protein
MTGAIEKQVRMVVLLAAGAVGLSCAARVAPAPAPATVAPAPAPVAVAPPVAHPQGICIVSTTMGNDRAARSRVFPASYWIALLVTGYRPGQLLERPIRDCLGRATIVESDGCGGVPPPVTVPSQRLGDQDLVLADAGETTRLVWVMTDRLAGGEAQGPIGIAEVTDQGLVVRSIGMLRAYGEHVTLRLARLGTGTVLVAEGESCAGSSDEVCKRGIRFLIVNGDQLISRPIKGEAGECLSSAFIPLNASGHAPNSKDKYRLETTVSYVNDEIVLREQLTISAAKDPSRSSEYVRQVRSERRVFFRNGNLVASGQSLMDRWLAQR